MSEYSLSRTRLDSFVQPFDGNRPEPSEAEAAQAAKAFGNLCRIALLEGGDDIRTTELLPLSAPIFEPQPLLPISVEKLGLELTAADRSKLVVDVRHTPGIDPQYQLWIGNFSAQEDHISMVYELLPGCVIREDRSKDVTDALDPALEGNESFEETIEKTRARMKKIAADAQNIQREALEGTNRQPVGLDEIGGLGAVVLSASIVDKS